MSRSRTDTPIIADRYATALFALAGGEAAGKKSARDAIEADFAQLAAIIRSDDTVAGLLAHPLLTRKAKAEALRTLLTQKKAHATTLDAVVKIAEAGRLEALPAISDAFAAKCATARGEVTAYVTTARALSKKDSDAVAAALGDATGKHVRVVAKEDASLLGGLKVSLGPKELDMSVAGSLERMRRALLHTAA